MSTASPNAAVRAIRLFDDIYRRRKALIEQGYSNKEIAEIEGVSYNAICIYVCRYSLRPKKDTAAPVWPHPRFERTKREEKIINRFMCALVKADEWARKQGKTLDVAGFMAAYRRSGGF